MDSVYIGEYTIIIAWMVKFAEMNVNVDVDTYAKLFVQRNELNSC